MYVHHFYVDKKKNYGSNMVLCGPAAAHNENLKDIYLTCVQLVGMGIV